LIISLFAEAIAEEEDKVITAGTGSGQPTGLTNCSIGSVACSGNLDLKKSKTKAVNCWKTLTLMAKAISRQAKTVMFWKLQRLEAESLTG